MSTETPSDWAERWPGPDDGPGPDPETRSAEPPRRRRLVTHLVLVDGLPADHWVEESSDGSWQSPAGRRGWWRATPSTHPQALRWLEAAVGGSEALHTLDDEPLTDAALCLAGAPAHRHERARVVSERCDQVALEVFEDAEMVTALRHVLEGILAADPATLTRSDRDDTLAGAVVWIGGHANGLIGPQTDLLARDLWPRIGVSSSAASRGAALLRRMGVDEGAEPLPQWGSPHLRAVGMPRALTGRTRSVLLARRAAAWAERDAELRG